MAPPPVAEKEVSREALTFWRRIRAALFESLAVNHPFVDGNKRTVFAATDVFLRINGTRIRGAPAEPHADIMSLFAGASFDFAHLEPWLRGRVEWVE